MKVLSVYTIFVGERLPSRVTNTKRETAYEVRESEGEVVPAISVPDVEV
jgi:hypothetical protein